MEQVGELVYKIILGGGLIAFALIVIEVFLYYKSWSILQSIRNRLRMSEDRKDYAFESSLSLINLLMTIILNIIVFLVVILLGIVLLYSIFYLTEYFPVILAVTLVFFAALVYICIKLVHEYNQQRR